MDTTTQSLICCSILDGILSPERLSLESSSEIVCFAYNFCEEMARMMEEMMMITVSLTSSPCKPCRMPRKRSSNNASYSISLSSSDTFFGTNLEEDEEEEEKTMEQEAVFRLDIRTKEPTRCASYPTFFLCVFLSL